MIGGCVRGPGYCGCDCHRMPGVKHIKPCCDKPPAKEFPVDEEPDWFPNEGDRQWWREKHGRN